MVTKSVLILSFTFLFIAKAQSPQRQEYKMPSAADVSCLAATLHREARGEGKKGMRLVASVVLNRVQKTKQSVCQVVKAKGQFSWFKGKMPSVPKVFHTEAHNILMLHEHGFWEDKTKGAMFFMTHDVDNYLTKKLKLVYIHGNHRFYKEK